MSLKQELQPVYFKKNSLEYFNTNIQNLTHSFFARK